MAILLSIKSKELHNKIISIYKSTKYNIYTSTNKDKIINYIKNEKVTLIFLEMGSLNIDYLKTLKKENCCDLEEIPIIILSNGEDTKQYNGYLKNGATDIIKNTFDIDFILLKTELYIHNSKKLQELKNGNVLLKQYKNTIDIHNIVSKTDPDGIITYANNEFCKISGYKQSELIGSYHNIIRHPDSSETMFKNMWKTIQIDKKPWYGKVKNKNKAGETYVVETIINPIFDHDGEILEYISIRRDITKDIRIKNELKKQYSITSNKYEDVLYLSKLYQTAIEKSNIVLRVGLDKKITYCNELFCKISGYTKEELINKPYTILQHPDVEKKDIDELWETIESGNTWKGKIKNITKTGEIFYSISTAVPIKNKDGKIFEYIGIRQNITEVVNLHSEIEEMQREIIYKVGEIGETRSKETGMHVKRVAEYSALLALKVGLSKKEANLIKYSSPMHDIGKVGIPDGILNKPGKLTIDEFEIMKNHTKIGYEMLKSSKRRILKTSAIIAYQHHEKWDGSGYPRGLKGDDIHLYGRITAIADVFDALGSERPYKKAWEIERILDFLKEQSGKHFDPNLVQLFFNHLGEFLEIRENIAKQYKILPKIENK